MRLFSKLISGALVISILLAAVAAPYQVSFEKGQVQFEQVKKSLGALDVQHSVGVPSQEIEGLQVYNFAGTELLPLGYVDQDIDLSAKNSRGPPQLVLAEQSAHASYDFEGQAGSGDKVTITDDASLVIPDSEWALIFWIKRGAISTDTSTWTSEFIFSNAGFNDNNSAHVWIAHTADANNNTLNFKVTGNGTGELYNSNGSSTATSLLNSTAWLCIIVQRESDEDIHFYIDATAVHTLDESQAQTADVDLASGLLLGARGDENANRYFDGKIAEMGFRDGSSFSSGERSALCGTPVRLTSYTTDVTWYHDMENDLNADIGSLSWSTSNASQDADHPSFGSGSTPVIIPFGIGSLEGF